LALLSDYPEEQVTFLNKRKVQLPGHSIKVQFFCSKFSPLQFRPPNWGATQILWRVWFPEPQEAEHSDQSDHCLK